MSASQDAVKVATMIPTIWRARTLPAIYALAKKTAQESVNKMKESHPWNDQTYSAKNFLFGDAFQEPGAVGFFIAHGVQYGVYLELANDRKNEILRPTIQAFGSEFLVGVRRLTGA